MIRVTSKFLIANGSRFFSTGFRSRPASSLRLPASRTPGRRGGRLIVTPRLEFPVTRRKQTSNQNPNRYKMRFLHSAWRTRFLHLDRLGLIRFLRPVASRINGSQVALLRRLHRGSPAPNMAPLVNLPSIGVIHAL